MIVQREEPSYKSYQYLYDYALKLVEWSKYYKMHLKLRNILLDLLYVINNEIYIKTNRMNYPIHFINFDEHIKCLLYEFQRYKFPRNFQKIIRQLQQYHPRRQKM